MKLFSRFFFTLLVVMLLFSCKKQKTEAPVKEPYVQFINVQIAGQNLEIKGSIDKNRDKFSGSWTGIGYGDGTQKEMYTVNVIVPKTFLNTTFDSKLQFRIFDIEKKEYKLSENDPFKQSFASGIYIVTNLGMADSKVYTTNETKPPFKVQITRYEKPKDSGVPFVGGKISGTLYNVKNLQDSIVIKDGVFDVRF
ncbi:DUF5025 domain-containing protein [Pedobacter ghigonis]|uniref:DUF5025 domain-containing protein n=1 Tax=Pedobacter ghigonis TaxID=2730403 RepID=UPI00158A6FA6|nr:DUF5025 domain-containing protein [Pedobacter ghigonis]